MREAVRLSYEETAVIKQQLLLSNNSNTTASAAVEAVGVSLRTTSQKVEKKDMREAVRLSYEATAVVKQQQQYLCTATTSQQV